MIESTYALYKLLILYMLSKVNFPLSNAQISEFFLEKEYTSYFHLQQVLNEMIESNLLNPETIRNTTYYKMTDSGVQTLKFFGKEISSDIRKETDAYLEKHAYQMRSESSTVADYYRTNGDEYAVHCMVKENGNPLVEVTLRVPTEAVAQDVCENWRRKSQEAYAALINILM